MKGPKQEMTVGFKGLDTTDPDNPRVYYELDYGSNCWGDVGVFYRDPTEDHPGGGVCYIRSLYEEGDVIYADDPEFWGVAYTYDDVLEICEGHKKAADYALEEAGGYGIEIVWERVSEDYEDGEADD